MTDSIDTVLRSAKEEASDQEQRHIIGSGLETLPEDGKLLSKVPVKLFPWNAERNQIARSLAHHPYHVIRVAIGGDPETKWPSNSAIKNRLRAMGIRRTHQSDAIKPPEFKPFELPFKRREEHQERPEDKANYSVFERDPVISPNPKDIWTVCDKDCHWPYGDGENTLFCANPTTTGKDWTGHTVLLPYCAYHATKVFKR